MEEYLTDRNWNAKKFQYEIGEKAKVKIWRCRERMRCRQESCRIGDVDLNEDYGMAVQVVCGGRQFKRSIPASKMEMLDLSPKEMAEMIVADAI